MHTTRTLADLESLYTDAQQRRNSARVGSELWLWLDELMSDVAARACALR